jgi:hypothetical protein
MHKKHSLHALNIKITILKYNKKIKEIHHTSYFRKLFAYASLVQVIQYQVPTTTKRFNQNATVKFLIFI